MLNREEHIKPPPRLTVNANGDISFRAGEIKGKAPTKPEELRRYFKLMVTCWELVKLRVPGKAYLADHTQAIWNGHVEWLLGDEVLEYEVKDSNNNTVFQPTWHQMLELDFQVRKLAYKYVNRDGMTIKRALETARADEPTLRKYFSLPISVSAATVASHTKPANPASRTRGRSRSPRGVQAAPARGSRGGRR